ncbi:Uncharacterised protein [Mycobacterium tuberculosis]|nr:Uncharacterised protein [Mycobacterium tuberculosis]
MGFVEVGVVVLVVARHIEDGRRPAVAGRESAQAEVGVGQAGALLVGADVARQDQHVGARNGLGMEAGMGFQVKVGQQLQLHRRTSLGELTHA